MNKMILRKCKLHRVFFATLALFTVLCFMSDCVEGIVFTRCQLARELLNQGFPKKYLREWVCLVEEVSGSNTKLIEGPFKDDSCNVGLFQINTGYFCRDRKPGGECNMLCGSLLSNNITKAAKCAQYMYHTYGFEVWEKFDEKCVYYVPNLRLCGIYY